MMEEEVDLDIAEESEDLEEEGSGMRILQSLKDTELDVRIVLVEQKFSVGELMGIGPGSILLFDYPINAPAWTTVNGEKFAFGKVVQVGDCYGLQIEKLR